MKKSRSILLTLALCVFAAVVAGTRSAFVSPQNDNTKEENDTMAAAKDSVKEETPINPASVCDEVIWVVGDEAILLSDVEMLKLQMETEGIYPDGDPNFTIPEQIAVQKLFLHQAALDSIEVTEAEVAQNVEQQINMWISMIGSKEKLEEYRRMSLSQIRQSLHDDFKNHQLEERMREKLVEDIKVSPAEVRAYFKNMPEDSIPYVPTEVEVEIITRSPKVPLEEINKVKDDLRSYTDRVTRGETAFTTLARLYSEDPGTARNGGELDYTGRGMLDPAFAAVAFNLTDPKKISKIVESEFGYHIIQLVDKRGDKIKVRHILRKPRVPQTAIDEAIMQLDSIADDIRANKFSFEDAATYVSDDKDTRNNHGVMVNTNEQSQIRTSKFKMQDLPTEIAREVERLKVGEISPAFQMVNQRGKTVCAIVKLTARIDAHRATITEDFQTLRSVVLAKEREAFLRDWIQKKIGETYVRMNDRYKSYKYQHDGWVR